MWIEDVCWSDTNAEFSVCFRFMKLEDFSDPLTTVD